MVSTKSIQLTAYRNAISACTMLSVFLACVTIQYLIRGQVIGLIGTVFGFLGLMQLKSSLKDLQRTVQPTVATQNVEEAQVEQNIYEQQPDLEPESEASLTNIYAQELARDRSVTKQTEDVQTYQDQQEEVLQEKPIPQTPPKPHWSENIDWEEWVGKKLLQKAGVAIVLIGMIVLLKYSFDNNYIEQHGRIALSALGSVLLLGAGEWFQKKYGAWARGFTGGGLALMYFTVWAAHVLYAGQLVFEVTPTMAMVLYSVITATGALTAIRYNSQEIAWFTVIGGYITPLLIASEGNPFGLTGYLFILALGLIALAMHKKWKGINNVAFFFTHVYLIAGVYFAPKDIVTDQHQIFICVLFFVLFGLLPLFSHFREKEPMTADDVLITILNGLAVILPVLDALDWNKETAPFALLALAGVYVVYTALALKKRAEDGMLVNTYLVGATILTSIAIFVELERWVAVGWAPYSVFLVWISTRIRYAGPWRSALVLMAGSIIALAFNMPGIYSNPEEIWRPFLSNWSLMSYVVFASLIAWIYAMQQLPEELLPKKDQKRALGSVHSILATILFFFMGFAGLAYGEMGISWVPDFAFSSAMVLFAFIAIAIFFFTQQVVWFVATFIAQILIILLTFIVAPGSGMIIGNPAAPFVHPWAAMSAASLLLSFGMCYAAITKTQSKAMKSDTIKWMFIAIVIAQVWTHVSIEIDHLKTALEWSEMTFQRILSGWWIVCAFATFAVAEAKNIKTLQRVGIGMLLIPFIKDIALIAAAQTSFYEAILWTIVPLVAVFYGAKKKDNFMQVVGIGMLGVHAVVDIIAFANEALNILHPIWFTAASLIVAVLGTRSKVDALVKSGCVLLAIVMFFDMATHLGGGDGLLRSTWWAIAALITMSIGFAEREAQLRQLSMVMFGATAIKLLILDFNSLAVPVRIGASIATGLLMIGGSYLYQRFDAQMKK